MDIQENNSPKKGPYRNRFFSSMDYQQYSLHFGPPKPFLKPVADPEIEIEELKLDDSEPKIIKQESRDWCALGFGRSRGATLPIIKQKMLEEESNYQTDKKESSIGGIGEEMDFGKESFKRSHSRLRSMSQNPNLLILSLLERAQRMQKCGKTDQQESPN